MLSISTPGQISLKAQQWDFTFAFSSMASVRCSSIAKTDVMFVSHHVSGEPVIPGKSHRRRRRQAVQEHTM